MEEINLNVKLVDASSSDRNSNIIKNMMQTEEGIKEIFKNRIDRLSSSYYSCLIIVNEEIAGFVNLVEEKRNKDFYFLDMGIKKEYRNKGIGTKALEIILNLDIDRFIINETKETNLLANSSINKIGYILFSKDEKNYYLLQKDKIDRFINEDYMQKLAEHIEKDNTKKKLF